MMAGWPNWMLAVMLGALLFEGVVSVLDLWWWPQPPALRWLQLCVEATLAFLLLGLAVRWRFTPPGRSGWVMRIQSILNILMKRTPLQGVAQCKNCSSSRD